MGSRSLTRGTLCIGSAVLGLGPPGMSPRGAFELNPEESEGEALGGFGRWFWQGPARAKSE